MPDICGCYLCASEIDNWPDGTSEAQKQALIKKIEAQVDNLTGTAWCAEAFSIKLNGNDKNRLFIPLDLNIISVTHVYIHCIELDSSWYTWDEHSIYLNPCASGSGVLSPELYYKLGETMDKGIFPRGYNNIIVEGTMGEYTDSDDIPQAIKQAAIIMARYHNDPTLYTFTGLKKSEHMSDYSYTNLTESLEDVLTGIAEADILLMQYIKNKPIILAP